MKATNGKPTLRYDSYRNPSYFDYKSRNKLHKQIFEELCSFERPIDEDKIRLGFGGALPIGKKPQMNRQAYFVIGLPASGKSAISNRISDTNGAIILDSDYAKRNFQNSKEIAELLLFTKNQLILFLVKKRLSSIIY